MSNYKKPATAYKVGDRMYVKMWGDGAFGTEIVTISKERDARGYYSVTTADGSEGDVHESCLNPLLDEPQRAPVRETTLTQAANLIAGDREKDYGPPSESFSRIAALWTPVLGTEVTPEQVALCLTQLKISRLVGTPTHTDSWVDAAGYIALGSEIAARSVR